MPLFIPEDPDAGLELEFDTKGDLLVGVAADTADNLPVGDDGDVLVADSSATLGVKWAAAGGGGGVTDHGALAGLADDDHAQYHTDARGDARYWPLSTDLATQAELDAHVADAADAHDASAISVADTGALLDATNVEDALAELATGGFVPGSHGATHQDGGGDEISIQGLAGTPVELSNHMSDAADAHDASAISVADAGGYFTGTDVEAALQEVAADVRERRVQIKVISDTTVLTTGDGKTSFFIDPTLNGLNLTACYAAVVGASSSGTPTVQLRRYRSAVSADMLSTAITIDVSELDSTTAATPPVINGTNDDVATGDRIFIDVDVAGTGTDGLDVVLVFS